jgi:ABC-type antimicrobial peptide transport system permease subunit
MDISCFCIWGVMFQHNFLMICRTFRRYRSSFFINLAGLSTGLACTLLIYLWISDELAFDRFHRYDPRLFQVMVNERQGEQVITSDGTNGLLGEIVKKEMPEVEYAVSTTPSNWFQKFNVSSGNTTVGAAGNFVGEDYFTVFSYELLQGNATSVLRDKHSVVISRSLAMKLFHTTVDIIGKPLEWKWTSITREYIITGIFKDIPLNSSYQFDLVLPMESWKDILSSSNSGNSSGNPGNGPSTGPFFTFLVLRPHTNIDTFNSKLTAFSHTRFDRTPASLFLRKYSDGYLYGKYENGVQAGGRIEYVKLFSIIAFFILIIACINFMNLSTARVSGRMKEVGLKKALGAGRLTLICQFLGESVLMSFLSLVVALALVAIFLPWFNEMTGKHLSLGFVAGLILPITGITLFTGLLAGSYPAFYLSGFQPALTLKGKFVLSSGFRELWVRKGLVVLQFTLSMIFIVSVIVVYKQIKLVQTKNPGYDKDNVIYFEMEGRVAKNVEPFLSALRRVPGVIQASSIIHTIVLPSYTPNPGVYWEGKNKDGRIRFYQMMINYDLIETLGIKMVAGRAFSRDFATDTTGVILNEAAVKVMGLSDPVGKVITIWGQEKHIVGVTQNFHFNSLHETIRPFIFRLEPAATFLIMARLARGKENETIRGIRAFYRSFNPGFSLDYHFLDEDYKKQYAAEKLVASLSRYFAGLAILLSGLGLFGLAAFSAERRIKEIGLRKVLGASAFQIVYLLSADLTRMILLSIVIGLPLSYWMISDWLDHFAYRIELSPAYFIAAAGIVLGTAWMTMGAQLIRASLRGPIAALKEG